MANEESFQCGSVGNVDPCSYPGSCRIRRGLDLAPPQVMALTSTRLVKPSYRPTSLVVAGAFGLGFGNMRTQRLASP